MDCNGWYNPKKPAAHKLKKRTQAKNLFYTYEVFLARTRSCRGSRPAGAMLDLAGLNAIIGTPDMLSLRRRYDVEPL